MAESSASTGLDGMSGENEGNIVVYQNVGVHGMIGLGTKHIKICSSFHPNIRRLKSTKVGSKLLVCIEEEVVETRFTHLAKIQLYVNTILRKNI